MRGEIEILLNNIRGLFPRLKGRPLTGLDIGSHSVKAARLSKKADVVAADAIAFEKLPEGESFLPDEIRFEQIRLIKKLKSDSRLDGAVAVSISNSDINMQNLKVTAMPMQDMAKAIKWKSEEKLSISAEESYSDYILLEGGAPTESESETRNVLVASASKKKVQKILDMASEAGIDIVAIEPAPAALAAYIALEGSRSPGEVIAIVDIGHASSSFNIVIKGELRFSRSLFITGMNLTRSVKDYCGGGYNEAELLKIEHGIASSSDNSCQVAYALNFLLERLVTDIDRSFKYYSFQVAMSSVQKMDRMVLTGGGARLKGLDTFLQNRLGIPVELVRPFEKIKAGCDAGLGPHLATVLGLATRGLE